jgi:Metal-dependent hydrolase
MILTDPSANTFPSNAPRSTIDYIAVWKDGAPVSKATPEVVAASLASDHRPVVLSVRLK